MITTLEVLTRARDVLAEGPHRWTRGDCARDKSGDLAAPWDSSAESWCLFGALSKVARTEEIGGEATEILDAICGGNITHFNDDPSTTYEAIISALDRAIEIASRDVTP